MLRILSGCVLVLVLAWPTPARAHYFERISLAAVTAGSGVGTAIHTGALIAAADAASFNRNVPHRPVLQRLQRESGLLVGLAGSRALMGGLGLGFLDAYWGDTRGHGACGVLAVITAASHLASSGVAWASFVQLRADRRDEEYDPETSYGRTTTRAIGLYAVTGALTPLWAIASLTTGIVALAQFDRERPRGRTYRFAQVAVVPTGLGATLVGRF